MNRQLEQAERHQEWLKQSHLEWPVQLDTYMKPHQQERINWLARNAVGRILEVGCSWGYVLAACHGHWGVDINPENIALAKQLARDRQFQVASALALPFPNRSFDTVLLADILEHLDWKDVNRALCEAKRVSKGLVLITLPKGDEDTEDATNGKHQFLGTKSRMDKLFGVGKWSEIADFYTVKLKWCDVRKANAQT